MAFIIPISTMVYATVGGLKATFTTSYMHTVIIFVVCTLFMFVVYVPNSTFPGGTDDVCSLPSEFLPLHCRAPEWCSISVVQTQDRQQHIVRPIDGQQPC